MEQGSRRDTPVWDWPVSVAFAVVGGAMAVGLIIVFTYLVDWIGSFWSQVVYFVVVFGGIAALAVFHRRRDLADPTRLTRTAAPITPAGLPGPFVITQAIGVLGAAMLVVGIVVGGLRGIIWDFSGLVLVLVGGFGLLFWLAGIVSRRRRAA
jgi:hypothetical protein